MLSPDEHPPPCCHPLAYHPEGWGRYLEVKFDCFGRFLSILRYLGHFDLFAPIYVSRKESALSSCLPSLVGFGRVEKEPFSAAYFGCFLGFSSLFWLFPGLSDSAEYFLVPLYPRYIKKKKKKKNRLRTLKTQSTCELGEKI